MIEDRDDERAFQRANIARIEIVATPHPSLPLKGGGEESEATGFLFMQPQPDSRGLSPGMTEEMAQ